MGEIYVFSPNEDNNDYSTFGLVGALTPTECRFTETANGESTITMTHPLDSFGRYRALTNGNILVAPVPVIVTPEITASNTIVTTVYTYKVKAKGSLSGDAQRTLYKKKTGSGKKKVLPWGTEVTVVAERDKPAPARWKVKTSKWGSGWVNPDGFEYVTTHVIDDNSQSIQEVQAPWTVMPQYFRIIEQQKTNTEVTVTARHISYDLLKNLTYYTSKNETTKEYNLVSLPDALGAYVDDDGPVSKPSGIMGLCYAPHSFQAHTNVANQRAGLFYKERNHIDTFLNLEDGICAKFDVGLVRDNYDLYFLHDPGSNRGIRIQYTKNMTKIDFQLKEDELITRIIPVGETKDGNPLYLSDDVTKRAVDSPHINDYPIVHVYKLECQNCKVGQKEKGGGTLSTAEARARMKAQAQELLDQGVDLPGVTMKVDYITLGDTEEYKQFKNLENSFLWDYIIVQHGDLGIDVTARIVSITWDVMVERMVDCTIGEIGDTLENTGITTWNIPSGFSGSKIASGTVDSDALVDDIISARHVQAESINADAIQAGAIVAGKIAADAVTANTIAAGAVTADKLDATTVDAKIANIADARIQVAVIGEAQIEDASITTAKIKDLAVTTGKINDLAVNNAKIALLAVGTANIQDAAINAAKIAKATITNAEIANATIGTAQIELGAITTALIEQGAVGTAQIADASITEGKIVSLNANTITSGTLSVERLIIVGPNNSIVYTINEANGTPQLSSTTIDGGSLTQRSITADIIVAGAITSNEIAAATILANNIAANAITADKIAAEAVDASKVKAGSLTTNELAPEVGQTLNITGNTSITALNDQMQAVQLKITPEAITSTVTGSTDWTDLENNSVDKVKNQYYLSTSATVVQGGTWQDTAPTWVDGKYMWARTVTTYISGRTVTSDPTCIAGATGQNGSPGKGVQSIVAYYQVSSSNSTPPSTWQTTPPVMTATDRYLWTYEVTTYTDNTTVTSAKMVVGVYGDSGSSGSDGKGIQSITQYYLATSVSSGVTTATAGWTTTVQTMTATNKYLWNYTKTTFTDNSASNTTPCIIGVYGDKGAAGSAGVDGRGISGIIEYYQVSSSATTAPTTWATTPPQMSATNKYLWNYTKTSYTDGTSVQTTSAVIGVYGDTGPAGSAGKGISSIVEYYQVSSSNSTAPTSWVTTPPQMTATNKYLWNYELITYSDSTTLTTNKAVIGVYGDTGSSGKGISTIENYYLATSAGSGVTTATAGWTTAVQSMTVVNKYLWNYEKITYTDSTTSTTTPCIIGVYGNTGTNGSDGKGITSIVEYYQVSTSNSTAPTTWATSPPSMSATNKYLWNYTKTTFTDSSTTQTTAAVIGVYGDTGAKGADGAAGKGVATIAEYYQVSSSNSTAPTTWQQTVPTMTATNKYLWNYTRTTYTDATYVETNKAVIGVYGDTGAAGSAGAAGVGVQSITQYYAVSTSSSVAPTTWYTTVPSMSSTNKYLWNYSRTTMTNSTYTETTKAVIGVYGDQGAAGAAGAAGVGIASIITQFYLSTSKDTQTGGSWVNTMPTWSMGMYIWTRDQITYTNATVSYTSPYCDSSWEAANVVQDTLSTAIEQTNEKIEQTVTINDLTRYLNFTTANGVVIGDTLQPYNVQILSDRVNIRNGTRVVAYFASDKLYIDQGELLTSLKIGNYTMKASSDGGLAIG